MAGSLTADQGTFGGSSSSPRRGSSPVTFGRVLVVVAVGIILLLVYTLVGRETVSNRANEMKTTRVILPPPPPPPPPPEEMVAPPPEPRPMPPVAQPTDTPPTPEAPQPEAPSTAPSSDPVVGDSALTAREGAGPSNYGLAQGDGGGTRIGGRPGGGGIGGSGSGGNGFAAYADVAMAGIRRATQADRQASRGRYTIRLAVSVDANGRITTVRVLSGSGDASRDARLRQLITGLQLSQRPPAGLPVMRIELNARSGG